jgi:hypothetical protein
MLLETLVSLLILVGYWVVVGEKKDESLATAIEVPRGELRFASVWENGS